MKLILESIFWISLFAILHSYMLYPLIVRYLVRNKKDNQLVFNPDESLPEISVIMAVRNEETIIQKKIISVLESGYPIDRLTFCIGSDASSDNTNQIISELASVYPSIKFEYFPERKGKIHIINKLAKSATGEIFVFTDAHAILEKGSLFNLIKNFKNADIHLVGGKMKNSTNEIGNVTKQELSYFENEYRIKHAEGRLWGCMMGAFGSFYAIRKKNWAPVPHNFISDDFYITLKAIEKGGKAIFEPSAIVFENVSGSMDVEFKRKMRIATGNFQNLSVFYPLLVSKRSGLAFSFFSHKVLRWFGPIFIILAIICLSFLFYENLTYIILFIIMMLSFVSLIIDYFLKKIRIHVILLRFISHFYYMNIALLLGMVRFMKGVKSNVWEPTKRS